MPMRIWKNKIALNMYMIHKFFWIVKEENRIFGNIVLLTRQNWFYETSKKLAQFKLNN